MQRSQKTPANDRYKAENRRELNKAKHIIKYALRAKNPAKVALKAAKDARGNSIESHVSMLLKRRGISI